MVEQGSCNPIFLMVKVIDDKPQAQALHGQSQMLPALLFPWGWCSTLWQKVTSPQRGLHSTALMSRMIAVPGSVQRNVGHTEQLPVSALKKTLHSFWPMTNSRIG